MYKENFAVWNKKKQKFSDANGITLKKAMAKIRLTVYFIDEHKKIRDELVEIRKKFNIPANFYTEYKVEDSTTGFIESLLAKNLIKPEKVEYGRDFIDLLLAATMTKWEKDVIKTDDNKIFKNLGTYLDKNKLLNIYNPKYINECLWSFLISAKLFEIPPNRVLRCMSNLLYYYWPIVENINHDVIQLQVYASTTESEFKFIWSDIHKKQKMFIKNLDTRGKFEYPNHDRDKKAYELSQTKMIHAKIAKELEKFGSYTYSDIPKFINRYKNFIEKKFS